MEEDVLESEAISSKLQKASQIVENHEDSGDEDAPDYSQLSSLAAKAKRRSMNGVASAEEVVIPFIPKRGEKDFEPTGFEAQARALEKSRKAMFDVISCERNTSSKTISVATWEPCLNRAIVELARGTIFSSIGISRRVNVLKDGSDEDLERHHHPDRADWDVDGVWKEGMFYEKTRTRLELLPEEALYLVERGSLECRVRSQRGPRALKSQEKLDYYADLCSDDDWLSMSVQQAFATMLFKDELTRERYQLYSYLRRLGYVVQRKSTFDQIHALAISKRIKAGNDSAFESKGIIADPQHPLKLVTIIDILLYPFRRLSQIFFGGVQRMLLRLPESFEWLQNILHRIMIPQEQFSLGTGLLGLGGRKWERYDQIFTKLQIVPSGHDKLLSERKKLQNNDETPEIFYYAWRPATRFKKTDPPLPEYRIAIVDARKTSLPSVYAFTSLLQGVPTHLSDMDVEDLDEEEKREWKRAQEEKKRNDESYGKGAVKKLKADKAASERVKREIMMKQATFIEKVHYRGKALMYRLLRMIYLINHCFTLLPPGCASINFNRRSNNARPRPTNIFIPLKAGRRNIIVAVNDCGTTSLLRFGEAEFEKWKLAGSNAP